MICTNKWGSLNLELMIYGNYVMIMIYVYMYAHIPLFERIVRDHACGGMIAYAGGWHEEVLSL